jgi:hypothetical protein
MKNSHFVYGTTVSDRSFIDREDEIRKLTDNMMGGINTMIISPRRWGKSSLVEKVVESVRKNNSGIKVAMIDLFTVSTEEEFLEKFASEVIKATSTKFEEWVRNSRKFFKNIVPKIQVSADQVSGFSISFDWEELKKHKDEILNLPEVAATRKGMKMIICLDEFQSLAAFENYESLEKRIRAVWQRQKSVTYCIYGSQRHMMTDIFNNPSKPLFRFGDLMILQKIERKHWIKYIIKGFSETGKQIGEEEAGMITDLMQCHSWYVQQLSHYTWNLTQRRAGIAEVYSALRELISANIPLYMRDMENLSITQINLLKAVAMGERQLTSGRVMNAFRLGTPRNVSKNKDLLISNDIIGTSSEGYFFLDPAFELWFRKTYLNIDKISLPSTFS